MAIKGITDKLRYQRAGKIYLGIKVKTEKICKCTKDERGNKRAPDKDCALCLGTGFIHRPHETDYFVLKESQVPELLEIYEPKPKRLNVMLPRAWELEQIFPQNLKLYGAGGLKCWGNGTEASFINPEKKALDVRKCPCEMLEQGKCSARAILSFRISELANSMLVYAITTGSYNSICNINSALRDLMWFSLTNRVDISDIHLNLWRASTITQRVDDKIGKVAKSTHYPMYLDLDPNYYDSWNDVIAKSLPMPKGRQEAPQLPAPDVTEDALAYVDAETTEEEIEEEEKARAEAPKKEAPKKKNETPEPVKKAHEEALKETAEEKMDREAEEVMKDIEGRSESEEDEVFSEEEEKISKRDELQQSLNYLIHQCKGLGIKLTKEEAEELKLIRTNEDYERMIKRYESRLKMRREKIARWGHESVLKEEEAKKETETKEE